MSDVKSTLIEQAAEIAKEGYYGWGNTMTLAADEIARLERENAELKQKLDRYTRMSESGETLGDHLDLVESHTELERENAELRKQLEQAKAEQRKTDALYFAVNDMMAHLGAYGEIDPTGDIADAVMNALFDIDGGNAIERGE